MTEVDWLLDQFAQTLDERDQEIAELRARLAAARREPVEHHPRAADAAPVDGEPRAGEPADGDAAHGDAAHGDPAHGDAAHGVVPGGGPAGAEERRRA
jgi:hypothetical protein